MIKIYFVGTSEQFQAPLIRYFESGFFYSFHGQIKDYNEKKFYRVFTPKDIDERNTFLINKHEKARKKGTKVLTLFTLQQMKSRSTSRLLVMWSYEYL